MNLKNKIMKKEIFCLFLLVSILFSCKNESTSKPRNEKKHRIIGKEYTGYKGTGYQIIEVDGVEYITTTSGGICPLVKQNN